MAASTERIALWILAALKEEWERDQSQLTCRTESEVLAALKARQGLEDADIDRAINFLATRGMLSTVNRKDGRATFPSEVGFDCLAEYSASEKKRINDDFDRRFRVYAVIVAIIALAATVVGTLLKR